MALGRPLGAKLFLEGKEVPFIGASITCSVGQASIAYIDLVPHKAINNIKPRTLVHLFVRDYQNEDENFPYVLAWQGEVFGINFGKTPASRTFSISCIDFTSYWDSCLAYYFNYQTALGSGMMDKGRLVLEEYENDRSGHRTIPIVMSQGSYFKTKIEAAMKKSGNDFLAGFIAIYDDIGLVNDFFSDAEDRLRIKDQILLHSSKQLAYLVNKSVSLDWFLDLPNRSSGFATLRSVIQDLLGVIFHDSVPIPFPSGVTRDSFPSGKKTGVPSGKQVNKTIGSFVFKPNLYMLPPPACNIFFPDEYSSFQFSRNFLKEPTRLVYMPELPARFGQGTPALFLPHVYEPPSFEHFMSAKADAPFTEFIGERDIEVPDGTTNGNHYGQTDVPNKSAAINNGHKREGQFLTNEEYMKGIIMARENMVPATSAFRFTLDQDAEEKRLFAERVAKYLFYKKRYQDRSLQITSHLKLSVVPGFPVLLVDDSDADQNVIAYCSSVTHRIYATEGGYTNVHLSYARDVSEEMNATERGAQAFLPPWFEEAIFGKISYPPESKAAKVEVNNQGQVYVSTDKLSDFYKVLLGDKGSKALTNLYGKERSILGSVRELINQYRAMKEKGVRDVQGFIAKHTARDYIKLSNCFSFFGASTKVKDVENTDWISFDGNIFNRRSSSGNKDLKVVALRNKIITEYRDALKQQRGFRG